MTDFRGTIFPLLTALALACTESESPPQPPPQAPESLWVEIAGEPFELELALDAASRHKGLSGRLAIEPNGGMLFVNTAESPQAMVMRDCAIPIDVAFLDFSGAVVAIHEMRPDVLDQGSKIIYPVLETYAEALATDTWPGYSHEIHGVILPLWAIK